MILQRPAWATAKWGRAGVRDRVLFFCGDLRLGPCNGSGARRNPDSLHGKGRVSGDLCLRAYGGRRRDWRYHSAVSNVYRIWSKFRGVHCQDLYGRRNSGTTDGGGLVFATIFCARKFELKQMPKASGKERWRAFKDAVWGLMMPVIILGGIYSGIFTPTEAAAVSAVYGLIIGIFVYKKIRLPIWQR